jgi:methionine--tRNA ligase beta chain
VLRDVHLRGLEAEMPVSPAQVAELLRVVDRGTISGKQAKEVYAMMRGSQAFPDSIVRERKMTVLSDERTLSALAEALVAQNPRQAESYRAGKVAVLGFFVGQMMKQTGGSADPAVINDVLKRLLGGTAAQPPPTLAAATPANAGAANTASAPNSPAPPTPALPTPQVDRRPLRDGGPPQPSLPEPQTPRSSSRDTKEPSPLAQSVAPPAPLASPEHTLTSASAGVVLLPGFSPSHAPIVARDVFARIDIRVGRIVSAATVTISDALLDLAVDVGDEGGLRRVVQALGLSFAPDDLVGKRVLVVCNLEPSLVAEGLVSHGLVLTAGPPERLALATVVEDVQPGHAVR